MKQKQIDSYWLEVKQKKRTKVLPKTFLKESILPESLIQEGVAKATVYTVINGSVTKATLMD